MDFLCRRFADRHGVDLRQDRRALARRTRAAEEAKSGSPRVPSPGSVDPSSPSGTVSL
ncbi:MAG: hypothetical protein AB1503_09035 [Bacillota bacterium]